MIQDYWDFIHETQDVFGFDIPEARDYYHEFKEAFTDGEPATVADLIEWGDLAADLADDYFEEDEDADEDGDTDDTGGLDDSERRGTGAGRHDIRDYDDAAGEAEEEEESEDDYYLDDGDELEVTAELTYMGE